MTYSEVILLPFLNKKAASSGLIIKNRAEMQPKDHKAAPEPEMHEDPAIQACAEYLLKAIESKDVKSIAQALCHLFEIMEEMPHAEGPHTEEIK